MKKMLLSLSLILCICFAYLSCGLVPAFAEIVDVGIKTVNKVPAISAAKTGNSYRIQAIIERIATGFDHTSPIAVEIRFYDGAQDNEHLIGAVNHNINYPRLGARISPEVIARVDWHPILDGSTHNILVVVTPRDYNDANPDNNSASIQKQVAGPPALPPTHHVLDIGIKRYLAQPVISFAFGSDFCTITATVERVSMSPRLDVGDPVRVTFYDGGTDEAYKIGSATGFIPNPSSPTPPEAKISIDWHHNFNGGKHTIYVIAEIAHDQGGPLADYIDPNLGNNQANAEVEVGPYTATEFTKKAESVTFKDVPIGHYFNGAPQCKVRDHDRLNFGRNIVNKGDTIDVTVTPSSTTINGKYTLIVEVKDDKVTYTKLLYLYTSDFMQKFNVVNGVQHETGREKTTGYSWEGLKENGDGSGLFARIPDIQFEQEGDYAVACRLFRETAGNPDQNNPLICSIKVVNTTKGKTALSGPLNEAVEEYHLSDFPKEFEERIFLQHFTNRNEKGNTYEIQLYWSGDFNAGVQGDIVLFGPKEPVSFDIPSCLAGLATKEADLSDPAIFSAFKYQNQVVVRRDKKTLGQPYNYTNPELNVPDGLIDEPFSLDASTYCVVGTGKYRQSDQDGAQLLKYLVDEYGDSTTFTCEYLTALAWKLEAAQDPA
ncbi:MAG: hypothetical protein PHV60_09710, partial [bacterium]|nr:hypothetical protein [bacterium]